MIPVHKLFHPTLLPWSFLLLRLAVAQIPTLDEMGGEWMINVAERDGPSIANRAGSVGTDGRGVIDVTSFVQPPLIGGNSVGEGIRGDTLHQSIGNHPIIR